MTRCVVKHRRLVQELMCSQCVVHTQLTVLCESAACLWMSPSQYLDSIPSLNRLLTCLFIYLFIYYIYLLCLRPHGAEALSDSFVWHLSVWCLCLSVTYIGPNSRTERPRRLVTWLLMFYSNYGSISCRFWDIHCRKWKKRSERRKHWACAGCSKVQTPPARPLQTPESQTGPITIHCAAKLTVQCIYRDLEIPVKSQSRSLKMVPFDRLGMV